MTMKFTGTLVLVLGFIAFSYNQQSSAKALEAAVDQVGETVRDNEESGAILIAFQAKIAGMQERELPIIETTNFDSFADEDNLKSIDERALKIETLYPDLYEKEAGYRAMASYKVAISPNFHSVVVTYKLGEYKMETNLINYDADGNILDYELIAFDEIAGDRVRIRSRLSDNAITSHRVSRALTNDIEEQKFVVSFDGIIDKTSSKKLSDALADYTLILSVLRELEVDPLAVKTDLVASKANPQNLNEVIVAIPEIVDEEEQYFIFNSHIVLANNRSRAITHKFFESGQTNQWVSDAIELKEIRIDTAPYRLADDRRAFGVRVRYLGMSRVNPYESETLSLFIKSGDRLSKVLNAYPMKQSVGEWDGDCAGEFTDIENILYMADQKTNG